jgi:hypothetical protein
VAATRADDEDSEAGNGVRNGSVSLCGASPRQQDGSLPGGRSTRIFCRAAPTLITYRRY